MVILLGCAGLSAAAWEGEVSVLPADGAEHISVRQAVTVSFSTVPPEGTRVWLDGGAVYDEAWPSPTEWVGTPSEDLARDATHHVLVDAGGTHLVTSFHTAGAPLDADISGHTYEMDLEDTTNLTWILPEGGWGPLLSQSLGSTHSILLMVTDTADNTLTLLGAAGITVGDAVSQSPEIPTWRFDEASFVNDPVLSIRAAEVRLGVDGQDYALFDLAAIGEIALDGTNILDFHVTTVLDARPIEASSPIAICGSVPCTQCPDQGPDDTAGCVPLEFVLDDTPFIEGLALAESAPTQ